MFLRASAVIAAIGLIISFFIFTLTRAISDLISYETFDKVRYVFRAAYYVGDILTYIPLAVFLIAFFLSRKGDKVSQAPEPQAVSY